MRIALLVALLSCTSCLTAATFTVTNTNDTGAGSLRQAITDANNAAGADNIVFNLATLPATITTSSFIRTLDTVTITGPGARQLTISAGAAGFQGFIIGQFSTTPSVSRHSHATFEDLTVSGFTAAGAGGAFNLQNTSHSGILSSITLNRVAVRNCQMSSGAGGVVSIGTGSFTATNCEFTSCSGTGSGGAINNSGGILTLTSCTFSGNTAAISGGAISGSATLNSCTISGNTSAQAGGGINATGTFTMMNTIVAGNVSTNQTSEDIAGTITSLGFNCVQVTTGATFAPQSTDITGVSPQLTALANNGGPTNTMELASTSPCLDSGTSNSGALTTDQRGTGFVRTFDDSGVTNVDDGTDIGAFERQPIATPQISPSAALTAFATTAASVPSVEQSFAVAGSALTQPVTITPPQHWEVSFTSGGTYTAFPGSIATAAPSGGVVASTTVYIRYNPSSAPPSSGVLTMTSAGAQPQNLSLTGVLPTVSSSGVDFAAAESATPATTTGTWRLQLSAPLTVNLTVTFNVGSQSSPAASPVPGVDFDLSTSAVGAVLAFVGATGNTVVIPAGLTTVDVLLTVVNDTAYEGTENVYFQVTTGAGYAANANNSFINITDNDSAPAVSVAATDNAAAEATPATDTATFTITFSNPSAVATTLNFTMGGTAATAAGVDYTLTATGGTLAYTGPSGTIIVPALATSVIVTLTVTDDSAVEGAETALFTLDSGTDYTVGSPSSDSATINNNDVFPTVTVAATDNAGSEAAAATDTGTFTLTLSPAPVSATTLNFTMGGTAATGAGVDYTLSATGGTLAYTGPTGTIVVAAGVTSVTINLTVIDDSTVEGATPETATLTLDAGSGYNLGATVTDTVSITDDDVAVVPTVTVSATDASAAEATPATDTGAFTILLTPAPNTALTINFSMGGTAATGAGVDYTLSATGGTLAYTGPAGTITIAPGTTSVVVTLTVIDDTLAEGVTPEGATFTLNAGGGYTLGTAVTDTVTITDNDTPVVSVATTDAAAAESAAGTDTGAWTITLSPAPTNATTLAFTMSGTAAVAAGVDYTLSATGGTLTYTGPGGTIAVPAGTTTVTITLGVVDDAAVEGSTPETATFTLGAGAGYGLGATTGGTVDITDNDVPPVDITTSSLPNGTAGSAYNQPIVAIGGAAPYTWTVLSGVVPTGLVLGTSATSSTTLAGTPTAAGVFNFTVQVTDGLTTDTQAFTVTIVGGSGGGGGGGGDGGGGCVAGTGNAAWLLLALVVVPLALQRRRRA